MMRPQSPAAAPIFFEFGKRITRWNYLHSTAVPARFKGRESCAFDTSFYQALEYPNSGVSTSAEAVNWLNRRKSDERRTSIS